MIRCWNCGSSVDVNAQPVPFGATCEDCATYLHACKGCRFYDPKTSEGCDIPQADYQGDKERRNLCEYHKPLERLLDPAASDDEVAIERKDRATTARKRFEDLFSQ